MILSIRNKDHLWQAHTPSWTLLGAIAGTCAVMVALPYIQPVAALFAFAPLPAGEIATILAMTALYVIGLDIVKGWYYEAFPYQFGEGQAGPSPRALWHLGTNAGPPSGPA